MQPLELDVGAVFNVDGIGDDDLARTPRPPCHRRCARLSRADRHPAFIAALLQIHRITGTHILRRAGQRFPGSRHRQAIRRVIARRLHEEHIGLVGKWSAILPIRCRTAHRGGRLQPEIKVQRISKLQVVIQALGPEVDVVFGDFAVGHIDVLAAKDGVRGIEHRKEPKPYGVPRRTSRNTLAALDADVRPFIAPAQAVIDQTVLSREPVDPYADANGAIAHAVSRHVILALI